MMRKSLFHFCIVFSLFTQSAQRKLFFGNCKALYRAPRKALVAKRDRLAHVNKDACDISHFRLMHRLLASRQVHAGNITISDSLLFLQPLKCSRLNQL